jgi:RNA polymerase sigma-70 factor (ECF subfamily)
MILNSSTAIKDEELLQKISQGCMYSFNTLYDSYWESAYSSAYKRLKDPDQAKDIVQEIFTYLWCKRETIRIDNLPAYLHIAIRNRVFKHIAKQKSSSKFFSNLASCPVLYLQTDSNLLEKEFYKAYRILLDTLSPKKKHIFQLRFEEELSTKDIANQLQLSRKTVQNQLTKTVQYLRAALLF